MYTVETKIFRIEEMGKVEDEIYSKLCLDYDVTLVDDLNSEDGLPVGVIFTIFEVELYEIETIRDIENAFNAKEDVKDL